MPAEEILKIKNVVDFCTEHREYPSPLVQSLDQNRPRIVQFIALQNGLYLENRLHDFRLRQAGHVAGRVPQHG